MLVLYNDRSASTIRIKLLTRFFCNPRMHSYLRFLARNFYISMNAVHTDIAQYTLGSCLTTMKMLFYYPAFERSRIAPFAGLTDMAAK
jgi:hypothetical protein